MAIFFHKVNHVDEKKTGLIVRGHASGKKGQNIVCAGVSAVAQAAFIGCAEYGQAEVQGKIISGNLVFHCLKTPETEAIINTALWALETLKKQYPQSFSEVA